MVCFLEMGGPALSFSSHAPDGFLLFLPSLINVTPLCSLHSVARPHQAYLSPHQALQLFRGYNEQSASVLSKWCGLCLKGNQVCFTRMYQAWSKARSLLSIKEREAHTQQLTSVGVSLLYGVVALVMGFVNKGILQLWPYSNTLLTLQMAASAAIIYTGKYLNLLHARPLTLKSALSIFPVVFCYNANVAFALAGLQLLNIPIFNTLKRLTPVLIIVGKFAMGDGLPPRPVLLSVTTIVIGCIIAGLGDLSFDVVGYLLAFTSCVLQSTYLILVEKSGKEQGYNSHELLLYNAILSLPVLLVLIVCSGEGLAALAALNQQTHAPDSFFSLLIFSLVMGALLNYSLFLCTLWNSALTTTVVGAMKALFSSALGFFVLGGVKVTFMVVVGVFLNTVGGIWYTAEKYKQKSKGVTGSQHRGSQGHQPLLPTHSDKSKTLDSK